MSRGSEPAWPRDVTVRYPDTTERVTTTAGLTIREHFAALMMQGIVAGSVGMKSEHVNIVAEGAVRMADALIAELAK